MISRTKLQGLFAQFAATKARLPKANGNLYEFYVFLQLCDRARQIGFKVQLVSFGAEYRVRASPGLYGGPFGFARLTSSRQQLEVHNGIELTGHSLMSHEADIVVMDTSLSPKSPGKSRILVECKLYGSAARLKGEVRKAVGAVLDWSASSHPSASGQLQGCLHCGSGFEAFFVTNVGRGIRADIEGFLSAYDIFPAFGVRDGGRGLSSFYKRLDDSLIALL